MMDANSAYQTVLLIRLGSPDAPDTSVAGLPQTQLDEHLAFIEAALRDCGLCRRIRVDNHALIGVFPTADSAFGVACSVQQACREHGHGSMPAEVRMLLDRQDGGLIDDAASTSVGGIYGLAETLLKQIPPRQIFATRTIAGDLGELSRARFRLYEQDAAGADTGIPLCQVICNEETVTRIAIPTQHQERSGANRSLSLRWRENTMTLVSDSPSLTIGRGEQSDIHIESELASRIHARLGFQQTNFILTDQSTNGTFVQIDDDDEVYLHHEQIVLRGSGVISLGRHIRAGGGKLIYFKLSAQETA
jgi:adenylate cyclase